MTMRKNFGRKQIGDKIFIGDKDAQTLQAVKLSQKPDLRLVVKEPNYITNGEEFILVKDVEQSKITLNSDTTEYIVIKALTKVLIVPIKNKIDEYYDEILIDKGACVEFLMMDDVWYIISSDGLKLG
jgi:hypothetical protein